MRQTQKSRDTRSMNQQADIVGIQKDIQWIKDGVNQINQKLERDYVTEQEFGPIKTVVYGMVGIILTGVLAAIIRLVFVK